MSLTATNIMTTSAALLNDTTGYQWNATTLLPYIKIAYDEFLLRLREEGLQSIIEVVEELSIPIGTKTISSATTGITDLSHPINIGERKGGSEDEYVDVVELRFLPNQEASSSFLYWAWYDNKINLLGATEVREVKITYYSKPTAIVDATTVIPFEDAALCLAARTAAIAASLSGGNTSRATELNAGANGALDSYINLNIKQRQLPIRRRGYRP